VTGTALRRKALLVRLLVIATAGAPFACEPTGDPPPAAPVSPASAPCPKSAGPRAIVFANVRVFDGARVTVGDVRVSGGRIESVGDHADMCNADVTDGKGRTLLPGLIDAHTHAYEPKALIQAAAFGVTTEIEMFGDPHRIKALREAEAKGERPREASLRSAGILATAPGGHGTEYGYGIPTIKSPDEADAFVAERVAEGSDFLKIVIDDGAWFRGRPIPTLDLATAAALVHAAHERSLLAVAHIGTRKDADTAIEAGVDGLAHVFVNEPPGAGFAERVAAHHVFVIPTLGVLAVAAGDPASSTWADEELAFKGLFDASDLRRLHARFPIPAGGAKLVYAKEAVAALDAHQVPILAGTDAANPGVVHGASLHRELELLVQAGLKPEDALAAATSVPAQTFHLDDRGRIAPGLRADLLLVAGDPTEDIRRTRAIVGVWRAGVPVDRGLYFDEVRRGVPTRH
jgi:imidazolonepropionase-like amidohydrolase